MRTDAIKTDDIGCLLRLLMPANRLAIEVGLATGLRIGDILSLRPPLRQRMTVREHKTGKSRRIYLSKSLLQRLQAQQGVQWVFPGTLDARKHRCRQTVYKDVKRAAKALRLDYVCAPHSTRKTFAVDLYRREGFAAVQRALNHDSAAVTAIYLASELFH